MPRFKKDALMPGTYAVRNADGSTRRITYTRDDVKNAFVNLSGMLADQVQVPLCWEHQDDARPLTPAERKAATAKNNLGHIVGVSMEGETLYTVLDVPSDEDARRLPSVKFVSPQIEPKFTDGTGKEWKGTVITHVAVTPRPVQHKQGEFQRLGIVRLSLDDMEKKDGDDKGGDKPDEFKSESDKDKDGEKGKGTDDLKLVYKIVGALRGMDIPLPDDTDDTNFLERLYVALVAKGSDMGKDDATKDPNNGQVNTAGGDTANTPQPVLMSTLQTENASLKASILADKRKALVSRLGDLFKTGRCTKAEFDAKGKELAVVQLSLGADGQLGDNKLLAWIEAREELPAGAVNPFDRTRIKAVEEKPAHLSLGPQNSAEADEIVKGWDEAKKRNA